MAARAFFKIDVLDLTHVLGGRDKQTAAAELAILEATNAINEIARLVAPKDSGMFEMLLQFMSKRRQGPGPTPAPALPPTSTLTR